MPPFLWIWIARYISGERMEKSRPVHYRLGFAFLFLFPIWVFGLSKFLSLNTESSLQIWLFGTIFAVTFFFSAVVWARHVPAKVSVVLAICAWATAFWRAWHS